MAKDFLGVGWKFPVRLSSTGEFELSQYEKDIEESILIILKTAKGERFLHPEFGCGIYDYVFSPVNSTTLSLIQKEVEDSLRLYEPRIDVERVKATYKEEGTVLIEIEYTVRSSNSRRNLVYPFYLKEGE